MSDQKQRQSRKGEFQENKSQHQDDVIVEKEEELSTTENGDGDLPKAVRKELEKLKPDARGLFSLRISKPNSSYSKKDCEHDFGLFGTLADIHFNDNSVYVRYNKKDEAEKAVHMMHDTYKIFIPNASKSWSSKDKDDISVKISKLTPDTRGWYSIRIEKPNPNFSEKDVESSFGKYGEITNIHSTEKKIYIRYMSWKEAANAIKNLDSKFKLDVPSVSNAWKPQKSHLDKGPQVYIGNISNNTSKEAVIELLERFQPRDFKFYNINNRNFAFAFFESVRECKQVISDLNGKVLRGSTLSVRICRDISRARYIAEDDYQSKKQSSNSNKGQMNMVQSGQGVVEIYVSNFNWKVTQPMLEELFQYHGQLAYVDMVNNTKQSAGECRKAYIGMYNAYDAKKAVHKLNQRNWMGLTLNVAYSTRSPSNTRGMRGNVQPLQGTMNEQYDSNPVDRALSISNKLDIMLEEVLDQCEFCTKIHVMMSELQQAMREIKYQTLRGEVTQGLSLLDDLINQVQVEEKSKQQQQQMFKAVEEREFFGNDQQMNQAYGQQFEGNRERDHQQMKQAYGQQFEGNRERDMQIFRDGGMPRQYYEEMQRNPINGSEMRGVGLHGSLMQQQMGGLYGGSTQQQIGGMYGGSTKQQMGGGYGGSTQQQMEAGYGGSAQQQMRGVYGGSNQQQMGGMYGAERGRINPQYHTGRGRGMLK